MQRTWYLLAVLLCIASRLGCAAPLYGVTMRGGGSEGELFVVDSATARATRIASITANGHPLGLRGIAFHPRTHALYGVSSPTRATTRASLVMIDVRTGAATVVGPLGTPCTDINFDEDGTLYAWMPEQNALGRIDLGTGHVTVFVGTGLEQTIGGGFAIRQRRFGIVSATSAGGTLDRIDIATKQVSTGPRISGAPYLAALTAMDYSADGQLFAVNTNMGAPAKAMLIRIDPTSGQATTIGPLPEDFSAIAFASVDRPRDMATAAVLVVVLCGAAGFASGWVYARRNR